MLRLLVQRLAREPLASGRAFLTWLAPYSLAVTVALLMVAVFVGDVLEPIWPGAASGVARVIVVVGLMVGAWYSERAAVWLDRRFGR